MAIKLRLSPFYTIQPAGDVLWILAEPGNVVPLIGVAVHRSWLSRAANR